MSGVDPSTAEIIRDLAVEASGSEVLEPGGYHVFTVGGQVREVDLTGDEWLELPKRKRGTVIAGNVESFAAYFGKHADDGSEVFADIGGARVVAVLDAHTEDGARHGGHRAVLQLEQTPQWVAWTQADNQMMSQQAFAEFLEMRAADVAPDSPVSAADLLEVAQEFHAHTAVSFSSGKRLASGATQLAYAEKIEATAGERGTIEIPKEFTLAIAPYEDCGNRYRINARFRYRLNSGHLTLGFVLDDPVLRARAAVQEITAKLAEEIQATVMHGRPAS